VEHEPWGTIVPDDFHVTPEHFLRVARAQRLHRGFLRRESPGEMDGRSMPSHAVGDFPFGKHARDEALAPAFHDGLDAIDVGRVESKADDIGHDESMILPTPSPSFVWRSFEAKPGLVCARLDSLAAHVFTTSVWPLGRRSPPGAPDEEWHAVAQAMDVIDSKLTRARQVHGTTVVVGPLDPDRARPDADIIVVRELDVAAAVQVADCVPLLMVDRASGAVAAVHAGWRGLAARAPQAAIWALGKEFGVQPANLIVALGPSIGACCYEVGPDVRDAFAASGFLASMSQWFAAEPASWDANPTLEIVRTRPRRPDRWFFDGWSAARAQLVEAGVPDAAIFQSGLCTASHPNVFCSYRRDGSPSGRLAAAIRCDGRRP
jgi:purine-nucleoside/S-methyl-5'-thioadenosine phosphorylase / adenosine deaminase